MLHSISLAPLENNPLVSILIANYNYADYLTEAIESVTRQTYPDIEIIICDDGSTDNSIETIQANIRKSERPIHLLEKENGGMASAINMAYNKSNGQIICLLDADDYYYPDKISHVVNAFSNQRHSGFLIHRLDKIDHKNRIQGHVPFSKELPDGWYGDYVLKYGSCPHGFPVTSALALRREVAEQVFPIHNKISHDLDEIIRRLALLTTSVISIDDSLGVYRIHDRNMSSGDVVERLEKMLPLYEVMWRETRNYLGRVSPDDLKYYPPLRSDIHLLLMKYVLSRSRLNDNNDSEQLWHQIKHHDGFKSWPPVRKSFWNVMSILPKGAFKRLVVFYWAPDLKLILSGWKNFLFN